MLTRRDFLARLQAAGLSFPLAGQLNLLDYPDASKSQVFQNDYFSVSFDTKTGRTDINRRNGAKLLSGSVVRALTGQGYISSGQSSFRHSVRSGIISDQLGEGQQVTINSSNTDNSIDFNLTISLYKNHHAVFIEAECFNRSSKPIVLQSIEPVCACNETGGALYWPLTTKLLTNGPMYYNPGEVADFSVADDKCQTKLVEYWFVQRI